MTSNSPTETVGLIAGSGRFPILFAIEAKRQGHRVAAIGAMTSLGSKLGSTFNNVSGNLK